MRFNQTTMLALVVAAILLPLSLAGREAGGTAVYRLSPASAYYEGCVGACKCPVRKAGMTGSFRLAPLGPEGATHRYRLDDVSWTVVTPAGGALHAISGTGSYRIDTAAGTHRLVLDVRADGGEELHLDSGEVPGGSGFPAISLPVDRGAACRDIWMDVDARPSR